MTKIDQVQSEMVRAMKEKNAPRKEALSLLLSALKAKEKDKREPLTEEEANAVILREIKQTKETLESAPAERGDIRQDCTYKIEVLGEFAPQFMGEAEIRKIIEKIIAELKIAQPTAKEKGVIMKALMPLVKGKADGGEVNRLLAEYLQ